MEWIIKKLVKEPEFYLYVMFAVVLAVRLVMAFQTPYFNYDGYYSLRQIDHIRSTGLPSYNDPLSYGGKTLFFAPLHYYIIALFSLIIPSGIAAKIIPNLFAAFLVILVYFISFKITKNPKISLITSFMSGFIPVLFLDLNEISIDYVALIIVFGIIYCMFRLNEKKYVTYSLILIFVLVLTTPLAFVLILGLLFYLLLLKLENLHTEMKELEIILFFTFLVSWINLVIYKNSFLQHGFLVIWQNIPIQILSNFFDKLTFVETFYTISIIPLIIGLYSIYIVFHNEKNKEVLILVAFCLSSFLLTWFKLLDLATGLVFISATLVILTSFGLKSLHSFIEKTKFHKYEKIFLAIIILLFIATAIVPSIIIGLERSEYTPTGYDIRVLQWASENIPANATIAASLEEGNIVTYFGKRKDIMDKQFLLTPHIDQRLKDLNAIYTTKFETEAVTDLNTYDAQYILLTPHDNGEFNIKDLSYVSNKNCFQEIFSAGNTKLYYSKCRLS